MHTCDENSFAIERKIISKRRETFGDYRGTSLIRNNRESFALVDSGAASFLISAASLV